MEQVNAELIVDNAAEPVLPGAEIRGLVRVQVGERTSIASRSRPGCASYVPRPRRYT